MCAGEQGKVRRRTRGRVAQHGIPLPRHRAVAFCHPGASSASVILRSAATKDLSSREPPCGRRRSFAPLRMTGGQGRSGGQGAVRRRTKRDSQEDKGQGCSAWHSPPPSSSRCFLSPRRLFRLCHPEERSDEGSFLQGTPLAGEEDPSLRSG